MSDEHRHAKPATPVEQRVEALEALMIANGLFDAAAVDQVVDHFEHQVGPMNGAKVVAKAWVDEAYRRRLLTDATAAIAELGFQGHDMVALENTVEVHNVVVCTLCSCYPWGVLGLPPTWYKSAPYRSRVVREPRVVLAEMGCDVPHEVEVRVWDTSAEVRYLVVPQRPPGTEAMSEDELAGLVTRDSMIGVERL